MEDTNQIQTGKDADGTLAVKNSGGSLAASHDNESLTAQNGSRIPTEEDTASIQKAIEEIADHDAAANGHPPVKPAESDASPASAPLSAAPVHHWFFTFMCMNIPVVGWFYLLYLAFNKRHRERRNFARAYLLYKLIFLMVGVLILGILIHVGLDLLEQVLDYMEML